MSGVRFPGKELPKEAPEACWLCGASYWLPGGSYCRLLSRRVNGRTRAEDCPLTNKKEDENARKDGI